LPSPLRILRSCRRLSGRELGEAARALGWLLAARAALLVLPYDTVSRVSRALPARRRGKRLTIEACRVAMRRATVLAPGASCLVRAMAAESFLRRERHDATVSLGVRLDEQRRLSAHAWVDSSGVTVTGHEEAAEYLPLTPPRTS
jgi:hypothetical protein